MSCNNLTCNMHFARIVLSLLDKVINAFINRMSQEERERFIERAFEKFLDEMTPADKLRLLETLMPRFLEGIDKKEFVSHLLTLMWKDIEEEMKDMNLREKVSLVANETGERISAFLPSRIKRIITPKHNGKSE